MRQQPPRRPASVDAGLTAEEEIQRGVKESLDRIVCEMNERFTHLHETDARFEFHLDIKKLCYDTDDCDDVPINGDSIELKTFFNKRLTLIPLI